MEFTSSFIQYTCRRFNKFHAQVVERSHLVWPPTEISLNRSHFIASLGLERFPRLDVEQEHSASCHWRADISGGLTRVIRRISFTLWWLSTSRTKISARQRRIHHFFILHYRPLNRSSKAQSVAAGRTSSCQAQAKKKKFILLFVAFHSSVCSECVCVWESC